MSRKNNRERLEGREEVKDGVQHPPTTTVRPGGGGDMMGLMQMWMEDSKCKEDAWREEMKLQREELRYERQEAKDKEERA